MIGRPGAGIYQMNGQPSAQNTRETGADGDLPGFRNWDNERHVRELATLWNVDVDTIPHWSPPTHAMQIWRYAEQGSIELLWISATNPAVSLPDLGRVRTILAREELFVIVQDLYPDRDRAPRRRRAARGRLGREDRDVDERRPHRASLRAGGQAAGRGPQRPRHLPRLRQPHGPARPRRRAADQVARSRVGVRGVEGLLARTAVRLQRPDLREAARLRRHPVAVHRGGARRHGAPLHRRRLQHRPRLRGDLRQGPAHGRGARRERLPREAAGGPRDPARRRVPTVARGDRRRVSRCC